MTVDKNGMCTFSGEDLSYHSCNNSRRICKCYHAKRNFIGKIGVCWGTKECEPCSCDGDESKCDFYEYVRKRAAPKVTNFDRIRQMEIEQLIKWFCTDRPCVSCPYAGDECDIRRWLNKEADN